MITKNARLQFAFFEKFPVGTKEQVVSVGDLLFLPLAYYRAMNHDTIPGRPLVGSKVPLIEVLSRSSP